MVTLDDVNRYCGGALALARNDPRGFEQLDLSADGFWRSFAAMIYAAPALLVSWVNYRADYLEAAGSPAAAGLGFMTRLALIDLINWVLPLIVVGIVSVPLGMSRHFGRWVIATNWLSLPVSYLLALPVAIVLVAPGLEPVSLFASLALFAIAMVAFYRTTRLSFDGDVAAALAITVGLVVLSLATTGILQAAFGIAPHPHR